MFALLRSMFDGSLSDQPVRLTIIQSVTVVVLATVMATAAYLLVGVHYPGVGYQVMVTLLIASVLAPVFLYPSFRVASQLIAANEQIRTQTYTDQLTGLPNSLALTFELDELARQNESARFCVHFVDLNRFRAVNMSLGHEAGDDLLVTVARTLGACIGKGNFLARFGSDEFVIVQKDVTSLEDSASFARQIQAAAAQHYSVGTHRIALSISVGSAVAPTHGTGASSLLKAANLALVSAKEKGAPHEFFTSSLATAAKVRRETEQGLLSALRNDALFLLYQPIVSALPGNEPVGFEALMRWRMPDGTIAMPADFIPVAESTGSIVEMGRWALRRACADCAKWRAPTRIAVNVSAVQMRRPDFVDDVLAALNESGLDPQRLELEITESVLITDISLVEPLLARLRSLGVRIALDDFGAGFAGINYLRRFMIDRIKVDKSIIDDALTNDKAANILRGVAKIAAESGLAVTVEGVDSFEKVEFIQKERCADELQGFLFGRPLDPEMVPLILSGNGETASNVVSFAR